MSIQICLVSEQAAANLLPALDPDLKPQKIFLLVTGKMKSRSEALNKVLREAGVQSETVMLSDEHDYEKLRNEILEIAGCLGGELDVCLNLTGGTKLMALAAQSIGDEAEWRMFYVDADTDELVWLTAPSSRQKLRQQLRLPHYLGGYGFTTGRRSSSPSGGPDSQDLIRTLVTQLGSLTQPLSQLNWIAQRAAEGRRTRETLTDRQRADCGLGSLLRSFEDAGLLSVQGDQLVFKDEAAIDFVKGGWLEHHVFSMVASLSTELGIRDKAANLEVIDPAGVKNELDVAFLAGNRLHVIECKTARMDQSQGSSPKDTKANDTLFKLSEICRRVGGSASRPMLVSYRPLSEAELQLARALHIETICAGEIAGLETRIRAWVDPTGRSSKLADEVSLPRLSHAERAEGADE